MLATRPGLGPLEPLLADPLVTDVMVNGGGGSGSTATAELCAPTSCSSSPRCSSSSSGSSRRWACTSTASPVVDARLPDGSRVHAVVRPLAVDGPVPHHPPLRAPGRCRSADVAPPGVAALLAWAVRARATWW